MNNITLPELSNTADVKEILSFIDKSIRKTTEQILETGYGFYTLKDACEREDIPFGETVEDRYNIGRTNASRWVKIGSKYKELMQYRNSLPTSYSTIYSIITMPKQALSAAMDQGYIHPALTFEDAEAIKAKFKADAKAKKEVKNSKGNDEDINPFEENSEKSQETTGQEAENEANQSPFDDETDSKDIIDGEFTEVKEKTKKKKLTIDKALEMLEINLDDQFLLAKSTGEYSDEELIQALIVIRGEK